MNIGLLLGDASGGLTDIDLDDPIARAVASSILPPTAMQSGRGSCPPSHRWYVPDESIGFHQFKDAGGRVLLEIRGDSRRQTLIPPSVYPEKTDQDIGAVLPSEPCIWFGKPFGGAQGPAKVSRAGLVAAAAATALVALLAPGWPSVSGGGGCVPRPGRWASS